MVEGLPALETLEGLLLSVDDVEVDEGLALAGGFPTLTALIGLLLGVTVGGATSGRTCA